MSLSLALLTGGRNHILPLLLEDPTWQKTRLKSAQGAASLLVQISKRVLLDEATALILPDIQHWYAAYVKANGPRGSHDDWDDGHDDGLLDLFESFANVLSASWLNFVSTDARMWVEGEDEKLAKSFANEVWKQLTWQRTDNQILAGVGIVAEDLEKYGGEVAPDPKPQTEYPPMAVAGVLNRIMLSFPDPKQLADNLDMVSDDDDGLALGAAQRLGITLQDAWVLRQARSQASNALAWWQSAIELGETLDETKTYADLEGVPDASTAGNGATGEPDLGPDLPANLQRVGHVPPPPPPPPQRPNLQGANPPPPPPPPPPTVNVGAGPATNTGRGGRRVKNTEQAPEGTILPETLRLIKEHAGIRDEDLAGMLGLSRPTLANVMKGKGWCVPEKSRREAVVQMLGVHIKGLMDALDRLG